MEPIAEYQISLFTDEPLSTDQITQLDALVHSSQANLLNFGQQVEDNLDKTGKAGLNVGIGLYILGKNEEAVKKLKKIKPCKEKLIYLAFALRRMGKFDQAIENLDKSLDFEADSLIIALEKAATYRDAKNFEAAEKELKNCANFAKISAEYHYQLARIQEVQGQYDQAAKNFETAIELAPNNQKALFHLAYRCDMSGDEDAAIGYYKQIVKTGPTYVSALINLAVLYEDDGEYVKASQCIENILDAHPNHQRAILFSKDIESSKTMFYDEEKEKKETRKGQILETPISDFELSVRSRNCLRKMNIYTLGDLLNISEVELLAYKNFGETSLREIKSILESKSLRLGMALEDKPLSAVKHFDQYDQNTEQDEMLLKKTVEDLQLSIRAKKCLEKLDLRTLGDLTRITEAELLGCKNFGVTSLNEINKALTNLGMSLRILDRPKLNN